MNQDKDQEEKVVQVEVHEVVHLVLQKVLHLVLMKVTENEFRPPLNCKLVKPLKEDDGENVDVNILQIMVLK